MERNPTRSTESYFSFTGGEIDTRDVRPSDDDAMMSLRAISFESASDDVGSHPFLTRFNLSRANGSCLFGKFEIRDLDDVGRWFFRKRRLAEYDVATKLLNSDAFSTRFPQFRDAGPTGYLPSLEWGRESSLQLAGNLAELLYEGGAHSLFRSPAYEALELATAFTSSIVENRYESIYIISSVESWAPWFGDEFWDATYIMLDRSREVLWILMATDRIDEVTNSDIRFGGP